MFEAEINAMQHEGARLREVRVYDLSLPQERLEEFIAAITCNPPHSHKHLMRIAKLVRFIADRAGFKHVNVDYSKFEGAPRMRYVKTVIIGVAEDPKTKEGKEVI